MERDVLEEAKSVKDLVFEIKTSLERSFRNILVVGEVTNLSRSSAGHFYFSLSDKDAMISAAIFKMDALKNPSLRSLKDGDKVLLFGNIGVYDKRGTFQIIGKKITLAGIGDLKVEFEKLKRKLSKEGLFDIDQKVKIPRYAKRVAIITAKKGAALQDFINVYRRRSLWMDLIVVPAVVQGEQSAESLRKALFYTIKYSMNAAFEKKIDVIVLTRGGGSLEDLWSFNDEALAWDIFNCPIPIISAVGHQVDFSISDFVSDLRCETPTAAAEILTTSQFQLKDKMENQKNRLLKHREIYSYRCHERLRNVTPVKIGQAIERRINNLKNRLVKISLVNRASEYVHLYEYQYQLDDLQKRMNEIRKTKISDLRYRIEHSGKMLEALNPSKVLKRGYSYVKSSGGHVVSNYIQFSKINNEETIEIHFDDGVGKVKKDISK